MVGKTELVDIKSLKTNIWSESIEKNADLDVSYDKQNDTFTMIFTPCQGRILIRYVDYYVGLLFRYEDKEIIGIQIDTFTKGFFPSYAKENKSWCLSDTGIKTKNNDFILFCKIKNKQMVEDVTLIASDIVKKEGVPLQPIYA